MSWLSDFVGPRFRDIVGVDRDEKDSGACRGCGFEAAPEMFRAEMGICPRCGHLNPLRPAERFAALFDDRRYEAVETPEVNSDVLRFRDARRYADRLKDAQARTSARDSLVIARGTAGGNDLVAACVDPAFLGGSIGVQAGAALAQAARLAALQRVPLIVFTGPNALRAQEGLLASAQACRVLPALRDLAKVGMPTITVLVAGYDGSTLPLVGAFGDIIVREASGHGAMREAPGHGAPPREPPRRGADALPSADPPGIASDLVVGRRELSPVLRRLVDLSVNRRAPAPVFSLHPNGADPGQEPERGDRKGADVVDHAAEH